MAPMLRGAVSTDGARQRGSCTHGAYWRSRASMRICLAAFRYLRLSSRNDDDMLLISAARHQPVANGSVCWLLTVQRLAAPQQALHVLRHDRGAGRQRAVSGRCAVSLAQLHATHTSCRSSFSRFRLFAPPAFSSTAVCADRVSAYSRFVRCMNVSAARPSAGRNEA